MDWKQLLRITQYDKSVHVDITMQLNPQCCQIYNTVNPIVNSTLSLHNTSQHSRQSFDGTRHTQSTHVDGIGLNVPLLVFGLGLLSLVFEADTFGRLYAYLFA